MPFQRSIIILLALTPLSLLGPKAAWGVRENGGEIVAQTVNVLKAEETIAPKTRSNPNDGAEMIFVRAGEFTMGTGDSDATTPGNEKPAHRVHLDGYWIYKTPVTVAQYRKFCMATGRKMPDAPSWDWKDDDPIVNATWDDAAAYSEWAGVRLPTEAEWEKAARGTDGRIYPWGNDFDPSRLQCSINAPAKNTAPVGSFPSGASPYGALDMAGNVWQWCADYYSEDFYKRSPTRNPKGPDFGTQRVLRGGSWMYLVTRFFRTANRFLNDPATGNVLVGFRCAAGPRGARVRDPLRAPRLRIPKTQT